VDAQPETEANTQTQTPQLREGPCQQSKARTLNAPSTGIAPRALRWTQNRRKSYTQHRGQESDEQSQYYSNEDLMEEEL